MSERGSCLGNTRGETREDLRKPKPQKKKEKRKKKNLPDLEGNGPDGFVHGTIAR
jgi:hypothetical protein